MKSVRSKTEQLRVFINLGKGGLPAYLHRRVLTKGSEVKPDRMKLTLLDGAPKETLGQLLDLIIPEPLKTRQR